MKKFFPILFLFFISKLYAQTIPDSLRVDWSHAGYEGTISNTSTIINVKDFGAYGDGVHDDYNAIVNAMNAASGLHVVYFPAGNYLIKSQIVPANNTIFKGDGGISNLVFDLFASSKKTAFDVAAAQTNSFTTITSGFTKGSTVLQLTGTSGFTAGSYAEIREANGSWNVVPATWATYCVGQIVKIISVNGNSVTTDQPLRINYDNSLHPEIRIINPVTNVGFECLKITRADTIVNNNYGYNINFSYAVNCWLTGVESSKSQASHVMMEASKNVTVSGSYFHDAFTYDGTATAGYGVTMIQHNSDCKVENCVFKHLRHPMIAKQGANGNVFAYNYAFDPYRSEDPHDAGGDMVLHGHYPFANLFEGNIGQTIIVDDTWGPAGPYNTFFRNRADLYGLIIFDQTVLTRKENIVGNEITSSDSLKGNYYLQSYYHFTYDNNIRNTIQPPGTDSLPDKSYYLTSKPYFWNVSSAWPSIGGNNILGSASIPAKERYLSGNNITVCLKPESTSLQINISADSIACNGSTSHIVVTASGGQPPYIGTGEFYKPAGNYIFVVTDAFGYSDSVSINLTQADAINITANTTAAGSCTQSGSITIHATGGAKPYNYSLNGSSYFSDSLFSNVAGGKYTVWIKDSKGCIDTLQNITVATNPTIIIKAKTTTAGSCIDDGTITITRSSGGVAPFKYSLNNIIYYSSNVFSNLAPGVYTAWVKDKNNCKDSLSNIKVTRVAQLVATAKKTNLTCRNKNDGTITITGKGGTTPYTYSLDSVNYSGNNKFTNLNPGSYKAWVKDAKNCIAYVAVTISNSSVKCTSGFVAGTSDLSITISPNPSSKNFVLSINSNSDLPIAFTVTDMLGRKVEAVNSFPSGTYSFGDNFKPGVYVLKFMQGDSVRSYKLIKR